MKSQAELTHPDLGKSPIEDDSGGLTTEELARALGLRENSILKRKSLTGSYFGLVPKQRENRRLVWPRDSLRLLLKRPGSSRAARSD